MPARPALALVAGLLLALPALAGAVPSDPRLPLVDAAETPHFAYRVVWPAGVRRIPRLAAELERAARSERTSYRGLMDSRLGGAGHAFVRFERGAQERFASDRFASLVVETRIDGATTWARPITWDLALDRAIGWRDLLADTSPNAPGLGAVSAFMSSRVAPALLRRVGATRREVQDTIGWVAPRVEAMPPFTLVPSREPGRIAGLTLHYGERSGFGVTAGSESFLPAVAIAPYLAEPYRALFGGEPVLIDPATRRAADDGFRGVTAFLHGGDVPPTRTLTVRGEAPAIYFGPDGLDLVLYPDSDEGRRPIEVRATTEPPGEASGVAHGLRGFTATFQARGKPLDNSCRSEGLLVKPAKGSLAAAAALEPLVLPVPIKANCEGHDG